MANRIFLNPDGYIEATIEGEQSYMSFLNLKPDAADMLKDMQRRGQPRLGLIDVTKQGGFTTDSNRAAMEILESITYDRIALFGAGKVLSEVIRAIILAMGKSSNTKIFANRTEAVAWLLEANGKNNQEKTGEDGVGSN